MFVDEFAKQLSRELQLDSPLVSDDEGRYKLAVKGTIQVEISPHEAGLVMSADVGSCPETEREPFFRRLLLANLLGQGTGRAMLGLDSKGKTVRLILALPYELPYLECRDYLEEFLNYAEYWSGEVQEQTSS